MSAAPRPPAVTLACGFVGFSAFLLLVSLIQALGDWGTIEMQKSLQPTLSTLSDRGFDLSMGDLLGTLRWMGLGCVLLLVAGIVFAVYASRGDQVSRVGSTVMAVIIGLLVLPFGWIGLLQAMFLLGAGAMLWSADARQWYATRLAPSGKELPPGIGGPSPTEAGGADSATYPDAATDPPPSPNLLAAPVQRVPTIEESVPPERSTHRPRAVFAAGLVTVIGSSLVGGFAALYLLFYGFARDEYVQIVLNGPFADMFSADELEEAMRSVFWGCVVLLPLAVAGFAAGFSLLARLPRSRPLTLALAWITAVVGVVLVPVPLGLLGAGTAVAVTVLLNRDESRAWTTGTR